MNTNANPKTQPLDLALILSVHHLSLSLSVLRVVFADFFVMNLILWGEGSSAAMPFGTLVAILALWFCISVPLTFIGAYFGFKKAVSKYQPTYFTSIHTNTSHNVGFHASGGLQREYVFRPMLSVRIVGSLLTKEPNMINNKRY